MTRPRALLPLQPLTVLDKYFYVLGGIVVPLGAFQLTTVETGLLRPPSKESGWRGVVSLFFQGDANIGFGLLLAGSAIALGAVLFDMRRYGGRPLVRAFILGGVIISTTYLALGSVAEFGVFFVIVNAGALLLYGVLRALIAARPAFVSVALLVPCALAAPAIAWIGPWAIAAVPLSSPACALAAYWAMWRRLRRRPFPEPARLGWPPALWLTGYAAAFARAYIEANRLFLYLPEHPPDQCYVATAAARGYSRLVGSWPVGRGRMNAQLLWLKRGELVLKLLAPRLHRLIRETYNRLGPALAACIRSPVASDLAHLSLKPAELLVRAAFVVVLGRHGGHASGHQPNPQPNRSETD